MPEEIATRDAFGQALLDLGDRDERVVVVDADLSLASKVTAFEAADEGPDPMAFSAVTVKV